MKLDQSSSFVFKQSWPKPQAKTNTAERFGGDGNQNMAQKVVQTTTS